MWEKDFATFVKLHDVVSRKEKGKCDSLPRLTSHVPLFRSSRDPAIIADRRQALLKYVSSNSSSHTLIIRWFTAFLSLPEKIVTPHVKAMIASSKNVLSLFFHSYLYRLPPRTR